MKTIQTPYLSDKQKVDVYSLWNNEYPSNLAYPELSDFDAYLNNLKEQDHILLVDHLDVVKGWYFSFVREDERWFAIIIDGALQGAGYGSQLLNMAKRIEPILNGWVIDHNRDLKRNGQNYSSPLPFYIKNDFDVLSAVRIELEVISAVKIKWSKPE